MAETGLTLYEFVGFLGVALYLGSYAALQLGFLNGQGYPYAALNLAAASCVLISLLEAFNMSSALIQAFWIAISLIGIVRYYLLTHRIRFTPEEEAFLRDALPNLSRIKGRKLLDQGYWVSGEPGTVLIEEAEPVAHLIYLASGAADVSASGRPIAVCEGNTLLGELTAISGEPATASVVLSQPSRYLAIGAEELRALLGRDGEIRANLESCVAGHMLRKLKASNQTLAQAQQAQAQPAQAEQAQVSTA